MNTSDKALLAFFAIGAYLYFKGKHSQPSVGGTVTGNPTNLLPCYDAMGNIVPTTSIYCPAGSTVVPPGEATNPQGPDMAPPQNWGPMNV